ncbi:MAG: hypothetical protein ACRDP5_14980, partial [Streptosporangiaceae bacterium]
MALIAFGLAAAPTAEDVYTHIKSVDDVVHALGIDIPPVTGHLHALGQALAPQMLELYGGALNTLSQNGSVLAGIVTRITTGFDDWMAKLDLFMDKQSHTDGLVSAGGEVLAQMAQILDNLGVAFENLVKADPGTVHYLGDLLEGASKLIEVFTELPTPVLYTTLALHAFLLWGGLLGTAASKLLLPIRALGVGLGGVAKNATAVGKLGAEAGGLATLKATLADIGTGFSTFGGKVATAAEKTGLLGTAAQASVIPLTDLRDAESTAAAESSTLGEKLFALGASPWTWAIVAAAAIADIVYETGRASPAVSSFISTMNSQLASLNPGQAILQINTDIAQLNQQISGVSTAQIAKSWSDLGNTMNSFGKDSDAVGEDFSRSFDQITGGHIISGLAALGHGLEGIFVPGQGAAVQARDNIDAYRGEIVKLTGQQDNLFAVTGKLMSGQLDATHATYTYSQSLALMGLAGVQAGDKLNVMEQKVANLILGYEDMSVQGGILANSVDAVTFASEQQSSKITALTQGWTAFIGMVTGGMSSFSTFETQVQGLGAAATDTATLTVSGGKASIKSAAAVASSYTTTAMSASSANSAVTTYTNNLIKGSKAQQTTASYQQKIATSLQNSGDSASQAKSAIDAYTSSVTASGVGSAAQAAARAKLIADLSATRTVARQAATAASSTGASLDGVNAASLQLQQTWVGA